MVTVGHNARVFVQNRRLTEREETAKRRSAGDMQSDAWNWHRLSLTALMERVHCDAAILPRRRCFSLMLLMLMDWLISQIGSLTLSSFHCVVKPPFSCQIPMVSAAHWLTPTPASSAQMQTLIVGIWIVLASATTDLGNQMASHYMSGSQRWSMIEWWILTASHSKQASGVLNISSREMRCGSRSEEGVSEGLEIVSKVGRQGEYIYGIGGVFLIRRHHLGCYLAGKQFA